MSKSNYRKQCKDALIWRQEQFEKRFEKAIRKKLLSKNAEFESNSIKRKFTPQSKLITYTVLKGSIKGEIRFVTEEEDGTHYSIRMNASVAFVPLRIEAYNIERQAEYIESSLVKELISKIDTYSDIGVMRDTIRRMIYPHEYAECWKGWTTLDQCARSLLSGENKEAFERMINIILEDARNLFNKDLVTISRHDGEEKCGVQYSKYTLQINVPVIISYRFGGDLHTFLNFLFEFDPNVLKTKDVNYCTNLCILEWTNNSKQSAEELYNKHPRAIYRYEDCKKNADTSEIAGKMYDWFEYIQSLYFPSGIMYVEFNCGSLHSCNLGTSKKAKTQSGFLDKIYVCEAEDEFALKMDGESLHISIGKSNNLRTKPYKAMSNEELQSEPLPSTAIDYLDLLGLINTKYANRLGNDISSYQGVYVEVHATKERNEVYLHHGKQNIIFDSQSIQEETPGKLKTIRLESRSVEYLADTIINRIFDFNEEMRKTTENLNPTQIQILTYLIAEGSEALTNILNHKYKHITKAGVRMAFQELLCNPYKFIGSEWDRNEYGSYEKFYVESEWRGTSFGSLWNHTYSDDYFPYLDSDEQQRMFRLCVEDATTPEKQWRAFQMFKQLQRSMAASFVKSDEGATFFKAMTGDDAEFAEMYVSELPGCKKTAETIFAKARLNSLKNEAETADDADAQLSFVMRLCQLPKSLIRAFFNSTGGRSFLKRADEEAFDELCSQLGEMTGMKTYTNNLRKQKEKI